ncbi:TonB-dependent receptor [Teredinibacter turnerae]|uniref:TonB-dependent receptor n=1 Tax=Teredinibacter turnerae TaxID=2426 RepID=UPI0004219BD4|nr:TonB-dependent receptor [Teredinibacter turnerae]
MSNSGTKSNTCALALAVAGALGGQAAHGDDAQTDADKSIETVVVVGRSTNTEITPMELEKQQANDLADVFRHIPAVTVGGSLGIAQKVYIRGMEDTLLNITVDGAPQTSTLFHHIGRVSIEPELLQKVEVQAGAGEATSGAGAIGGTIRFNTKSARDLLERGETVGAMVKGNYFSNNGYKGSASVYSQVGAGLGVLASYTAVERDNMEDGNGDEIRATDADQSLAFVKLNSQIADNHRMTLSYEAREESGLLGRRPNWVVTQEEPLYPMEGERNTLVFNYTGRVSAALNVEATLYDTTSDLVQDGPYGLYNGQTQSTGFDIRNSSHLGTHTLTYGIEAREDTVEAGPADDETLQMYLDEGWDTFVSESGSVLGVYAQNHWQITAPLLLSFGLRYDSYSLEQENYNAEIDSSGVSANIGFSYALTPDLKLVAGHAQALRGKEIGDSFTLSDSTIDPDLEPETVENNEVGIEYNSQVVAASAAVYQSTISDVIYDQTGGPIYYENIGEVTSSGIELKSAFHLDQWYLAASLSMNDTEINGNAIDGYEHNGLGTSRGDTFGLEASYNVNPHWEAGWNFTYVRKLADVEVLHRSVELDWIDNTQYITRPSYKVHDIYLRWTPLNSDALSFNLAVQNLFNEHYRDHSSVADYSHIGGWEIVSGVYEAGRDIRLTASYRF